jgi:hypothetical protein
MQRMFYIYLLIYSFVTQFIEAANKSSYVA